MYNNVTRSTVRASSVSLAKARGPRSARSKFYSALMTSLGGDTGNAISEAFVGGDKVKFEKLMAGLTASLAKTVAGD